MKDDRFLRECAQVVSKPFIYVNIKSEMSKKILVKALFICSILTGIWGSFNAQGQIQAIPSHTNKEGKIVKSLYGDEWGTINGLNYPNWGGGVTVTEKKDENNKNILEFANLGYQPIELPGAIDVSSATHLNIDIYPTEATSTIYINLIDWSVPGQENEKRGIYHINKELEAGIWNSIAIPLTDFTSNGTQKPLEGFTNINAIQMTKEGGGTITAYFGNLFFYDNDADPIPPTQIQAAIPPTLNVSNVVNFYSTKYGTANDFAYEQWGGTTEVSNIDDTSDNPILEFSKFNRIAMQYNPNEQLLSIDGKNRLHIAVYTDKDITGFKLNLFRYENRLSSGSPKIELPTEEKNLIADTWNYIDFDISDFYDQAEGYISTIQLDGGDGNSTIYVDHIYFYGDTPPVTEEILAAKTPELRSADVVNFYSTKYGMDTQLSFQGWGGTGEKSTIKDSNGNNILKLTEYSYMGILYRESAMTLDISNTDKLHLEVYPIKEIANFKVKLLLYAESSPTGEEIKIEPLIGNLTAGQWHSIDIDISDFGEASGYKLTAIQPIVVEGNGEFYMDHIYFYNSQSTAPTADEPAFPAYTPPVRLDANVLSVFSHSYESLYTNAIDGAQVISFGGDKKIIQLTNTNSFPIDIKVIKDVSRMDTFHIDIYSKEAEDVSVFLKGGGKEKTYPVENLVKERWNRIDIPLSFFKGALRSDDVIDLKNLEEVGIKEGNGKTFFIDNIYFFKKQVQPTIDIHALNRTLGRGINLGTIFDNPVTEWEDGFLDLVKNAGFDHIRLPIRWDDQERSLKEDPYNIDESFILEIQRVVDLAISKGLPVIINMHNYNPLYEKPEEEEARFLNMWGQIAEYFQHYDPSWLLFEPLNEPQDKLTPDKWNDLLVKALAKIREKNPNRAVLIGTADWGGIGELENLELPVDPNLILTIHYYEPFNFTHQGQEWMENPLPAGVTWNDTQDERDAVNEHFARIESYRKDHNNIPVHIGEFGAFYPSDIDSRVLWATYVSNKTRLSGYSFSYWDFHIYMDKGGIFSQSMQDAILKNKIPAKPAKDFAILPVEMLYDSKNPGSYSWDLSNIDGSASVSVGSTADGFEMNITKGGSESYHIQPALKGLNLEKDKTYQVTFNAKASESGFTFNSYMSLDETPWTQYGSLTYSPETEAKTFSYIVKGEDDPATRLAYDLGGVTGTTSVTVTISDITIREISAFILAADKPVQNNDKVLSVYSSYYTDNLSSVAYPTGISTQKSDVKDDQGGLVILLSDFDNQAIELGTTLVPGDKKNLCLSVYPGSFLDLVITVKEGSISQAYTYTLNPHDWNKLDIDLSSFLSKTGGKISQITLSGGTGEGRKLYLDHIFFYHNSGSGPTDPEEPTAPVTEAPEPTPSEEKVISIFSDPYNDISSSFDQLEGQTTKVKVVIIGNDSVWQLTTPNILSINVGNIDVTRMRSFHLNVWTSQAEKFRIYLFDGTIESPAIELMSIGQKWNQIDIPLSSFQSALRSSATVDLGNLRAIRIETDSRSTFYLDNLYFSTNETVGNTITESGSVTIKIIDNLLFVESPKDIRSLGIFSTSGRMVMHRQINRPEATLDLNLLDNGVYILKVVYSDGEIKTLKFLKKK